MTVATNINRADFTITAGTTDYPYTFRIREAANLVVMKRSPAGAVTPLVLNTDYTVTGAGDYNGGNVIVSSQFAIDNDGYGMSVRRVLDIVQETSIRNQGKFYPETHEDVFDYLTMVDQQQQEQIGRSLKFDETLTGVDATLPAPDPGKGLKWNAVGDGLVNTDRDPDQSANEAAQSAQQAAQSAQQAAQSEANAAATYDEFDDRYLGSKTSDPTTDNDGDPLIDGALYWNSVAASMRVYVLDSAQWRDVNATTSYHVETYDGGTVGPFTLPSNPISKNNIDVYISGVYQQKSGFNVSGDQLTFTSPTPVGVDNIEVVVATLLPVAAADASNVVYSPGGAGAVQVPLDIIIKDFGFNPRNFGADPDGNADSTAAFTAAANALVAYKGGGEIDIGPGTFLLLDLPMVSGVRWVGRGKGATRLKKNGGGIGTYIIKGTGTVGVSSLLQNNAAGGLSTFTVASAAVWNVGDLALIRENTYVNGTAGRKQQILRVIGKSGNTLTFAQPLFEAYSTAAGAELCVLNAITSAGLYDLFLEGVNADLSGGCFKAIYGYDIEVQDVKAQYFSDRAAFGLQTCYDTRLISISAYDGINYATSGRGYGVEFDEACALSSVVGSHIENTREATFTNRTIHCKFARNTLVNNYDSGFNTHGSGVRRCTVEDNEIIGVQAGHGIAVGFGTHTAADSDISIRRNRISFVGGSGISINAPAGKENVRIELESNKIINPGVAGTAYGILVQNATLLRSADNFVDGGGNANVQAGIYALTSINCDFASDSVRNIPNGYGIRYDSVSDTNFIDCNVQSVGLSLWRADGANVRTFVRSGFVDSNSFTAGAGSSWTGRTQRGKTTITFSAQSTVTQTILFPTAYPAGIVPTVVGTPEDALGAWRFGVKNVTNTSFQVTVTDVGGASRTGSITFNWTATE